MNNSFVHGSKSQVKKKLNWEDYFAAKANSKAKDHGYERSFPHYAQVSTMGTFDATKQSHHGQRTDYMDQQKTQQVAAINRIFDGQRNRVPTSSTIFNYKQGMTDPTFDHSVLAQKKKHAKFAPGNVYNPQSWTDLIAKTMDTNTICNNTRTRDVNENINKTKRML